ncbi:hypothetical protein SS50377_27892 [Spironucleus salmonicida]|uniref:Uncharacterized protein n=1 Tax=Spironucleus salmonicida TaxID=348837 RepID=A0A9P8LKL9_9EUKA|nr:hypothetical protein SS50377_27892 [Spironucleus salmonicida]
MKPIVKRIRDSALQRYKTHTHIQSYSLPPIYKHQRTLLQLSDCFDDEELVQNNTLQYLDYDVDILRELINDSI